MRDSRLSRFTEGENSGKHLGMCCRSDYHAISRAIVWALDEGHIVLCDGHDTFKDNLVAIAVGELQIAPP